MVILQALPVMVMQGGTVLALKITLLIATADLYHVVLMISAADQHLARHLWVGELLLRKRIQLVDQVHRAHKLIRTDQWILIVIIPAPTPAEGHPQTCMASMSRTVMTPEDTGH